MEEESIRRLRREPLIGIRLEPIGRVDIAVLRNLGLEFNCGRLVSVLIAALACMAVCFVSSAVVWCRYGMQTRSASLMSGSGSPVMHSR